MSFGRWLHHFSIWEFFKSVQKGFYKNGSNHLTFRVMMGGWVGIKPTMGFSGTFVAMVVSYSLDVLWTKKCFIVYL